MSIYDRDYFRRRQDGYGRPPESMCRRLIVVNVAMFLLCYLSGGLGRSLVDLLALNSLAVRQFQVWRFFTYMFVHGGFWHLFFNMYALHIFGKLLEGPLDPRRFLILYLTSGVIGGLLWQLANWNSFALCIGASGAVFGVMVAAAMAYPDARFMLIIPPMPVKLWALVWVYCALEVFQTLDATSSIAHLAHLGGALGGFIYMRRLGCRLRSPRLDALARWWGSLMDSISSVFVRRKGGPRRFPGNVDDAPPPGGAGELDSGELNRILDKISHMGYNSLTDGERDVLQQASEYLKRR